MTLQAANICEACGALYAPGAGCPKCWPAGPTGETLAAMPAPELGAQLDLDGNEHARRPPAERHEAMTLFEPAPEQLGGQSTMLGAELEQNGES